tara:strand:+ start:809 stop:1780 length:972 start_codon:yes stop_codon:yes gene_type:complete
MKILITGATGFIGSHLTDFLLKKGMKVVAFDRYNPNYNLGWLEHHKKNKNINFIFGDVRDYDSVYKSMKGCKAVFHLAALGGIPYSYDSPLAYYKTNVEGSYNVLEAAKVQNLNQIILTSTSETYGTAQYVPIDEKHPMSAQSPYSASKISADFLGLSYWNSFNMPIKIVRPFNVFGPRQSPRAVIPSIIIQALNNKNKIKLGNVVPSRDYTFVTDTCEAYYKVFKSKKIFGQILNIGTNKEFKIKDIALKVFKKLDVNPKIIHDTNRVRSDKSEVKRLLCDNKKILKSIGWKPKVSFDEGLSQTINWYKTNQDIFDYEIYHI